MINFKELIKERDEMQAILDDVRMRIDNINLVKSEVPDWLWEEEATYKTYQESLINRIGSAITAEDIAETKRIKFDLDKADYTEDKEMSNWVKEITNKLMSGEIINTNGLEVIPSPFNTSAFLKEINDEEVEKLKQETLLDPFNSAEILQVIAGVDVSEELQESEESSECESEHLPCNHTSKERLNECIAESLAEVLMFAMLIAANEKETEDK